ncbi:MAG: phage head-tail connector protein [Desulfuromonadales bacterium]|nr:phage head-tail connector protein [Desulfuromonadales bacterium]
MISLARLKTLLGITSTDHDALLPILEAQAVDWLERQTDRHFGAVTAFDETTSGHGGATVWLLHDPVGAVTVSTRAGVGSTWVAVDAADFEVDGRKIVHTSAWPAGPRTVRLEYSAGYAVDAGPGDVENAIVAIVGDMLRTAQQSGATVSAESLGDYSVTYGGVATAAADSSVQPVIRKWRRVLV